ncbi:MAG TPA: HEAT repeat domain-containing protein [Planctomycetaceae bacterium]|nr:HEAT repeat domain-containing protein [Planctomycetaceae bacterium]
MNRSIRPLLTITVVLLMSVIPSAAQDSGRITLDAATREKCVGILREGLHGDEFWPSMHAAEALTLAGYSQEVIAFLDGKLDAEQDDQKKCGLARETARAGDRSTIRVMQAILVGDNPYGHVHAAESLFKVAEIGDGPAMRRGLSQNDNIKLKLMAAGALARRGDAAAMQTLRELLGTDDPSDRSIAAWVLGQIGDSSDIPRLTQQMARCPDDATRASFEHALAIIGDESGLKALERNLSSEDSSIRTYAAAFASDAHAVSTAPRLKEMLQDPFADARIRAAQSLLVLAGPEIVPFSVETSAVLQELNPNFCWFHPRVAAIPGHGKDGGPAVVMTIQKHLGVSDHYSGLYTLRTDDLGQTWTGPMEIPELASQKTENNETIAVCDVTPGWLAHSGKLLAIGIRLRYSEQGKQLLDQPRSHECAYAVYDPKSDKWTPWKALAMPETDGKFFLVSPGCVQWLEQADGTLLIPMYFRGPEGSDYTTTVLHCSFDGQELKYLAHGDELTLKGGRGLYEPSLTRFQDRYFLTLRHDTAAYVTTSTDGLHFEPVRKWTFDDDQDLGSYNTQSHWLAHSNGLFLTYTRRGANNDHITRNRAPIFIAQVDPDKLQVLRRTEQILLPERGVMLGNFGAAAITPGESWVTDSEFHISPTPHPKGADGTTWLGRVQWSIPNQLIK